MLGCLRVELMAVSMTAWRGRKGGRTKSGRLLVGGRVAGIRAPTAGLPHRRMPRRRQATGGGGRRRQRQRMGGGPTIFSRFSRPDMEEGRSIDLTATTEPHPAGVGGGVAARTRAREGGGA
jgi:hypothetical protein